MMHVKPIGALEDNYMYLVTDKKTGKAAVVDPVDVDKALEAAKSECVDLVAALITHHHWDHAGGTKKLAEVMGANFPIYGFDDGRIEALNNPSTDQLNFKVGGLDVTSLHTPCHTTGHICYYVRDENQKAVFTGDTLFIAGCGRFFEGSADDMNHALNVVLSALPDETKVYCGHEYTVSNLLFAKSVESGNQDIDAKLKWAKERSAEKKPTVPSTIGEEKRFNPFMRVSKPSVLEPLKVDDPVKAMKKLREMKNSFKASI
uniref:hydroxyacylglutathione hydrolase n=1 Tax=Steinernema glaseri TaxID=37863 RepID=A0A1I7ZLP3_9BILA